MSRGTLKKPTKGKLSVLKYKYWGVSSKTNFINTLKDLGDDDIDMAVEIFLWVCTGKFPDEKGAKAGRKWLKENSDEISALLHPNSGIEIRYAGVAQLIGERGDLWVLQGKKYTARQSDHRVKQEMLGTFNVDKKACKSVLDALWPAEFACPYLGAIAYNNYVAASDIDHSESRLYLGLVGAMLCLKFNLIMINGMAPIPTRRRFETPTQIRQRIKNVNDLAYGPGSYFPQEWADKSDKEWEKLVDKIGFYSPAEELRQQKRREKAASQSS